MEIKIDKKDISFDNKTGYYSFNHNGKTYVHDGWLGVVIGGDNLNKAIMSFKNYNQLNRKAIVLGCRGFYLLLNGKETPDGCYIFSDRQ